jgi:hypothetical protein
MSPANAKLLNEIHRLKNASYERCLWHTMTCTGAPIRAHAIQNSRALESLAQDGHVVMFKPELRGTEFGIPFQLVGRNLATTFAGLCSEHDTLLFLPIDTNEIEPANAEHRFLVAYRAVLKGLHSALSSAQMVQLTLQKGVELGHFAEDGPEARLAATKFIAGMQMFGVAQCFHHIYTTKGWDSLPSATLQIPTPSPTLAASGVCLPVEAIPMLRANKKSLPFLVFSIFPQGHSLYVQFSWLPPAEAVMRRSIDGIVTACGDHQFYLLSKFILKYTETFTLRPSVYASFTKQQVEEMTRYFVANGTGERAEWDDPKLYLFGPVS